MTSSSIESHIAARVAHRLGLAACFGAALVGKAVFNPSLGLIHSKTTARIQRKYLPVKVL